MLTPEYLQGLPDELAALTENLETQLIEDIARRVAKAGEITDTAAYQIMRLKEMGASTEYIKKLLADYTKQSEDAIERMIFDAAQTDSEFYETVYARTGRSYVPYEYNDYLQQLAVAAINQTKGELKNLTQSMGFAVRGSDGRVTFKPAAKAYQSAMDKAQMLVSTGGMDYITAVRMAVNDLAASGLRFVDYDSGIRNHADVAARRAVLTGVSQMTGKIAEHNAAELGTDVVEVDAHAGARPDHAAWQGKWYSLTGKDKRYPLLSQATSYGTVSGLKGANCRHDFYPVIPGIDEPAYTEEELRNIDPPPVKIGDKTYTYYEAEQRQREMERAIRKTKRQIIAAQASGDTEQFTAKSVLLRRQREQYADFSKKAGLVARNERTQVAEFGRSAGSKSSWAARKAKTAKSGGSGSSGGHAVTVNVPTPADNGGKGKLYRDVGLDKSGGSGIIKSSNNAPAKSLSLSNLNEFDEWQKKYYSYNSGVSFARNDNQNIYTYTGGAYDAINALERGGEQLERARRCYGEAELSKYEGIGNKISEELSKFKLHEPINVRRVVGNVDYITGATSSVEDMKNSIGKVFTEKGFTSATVLSDSALPFASGKKTESTRATLDIYVPSNSRGAYIYKISEHPAEFEYLLDRNTKFKVIDAGEREVFNKYTGETTTERFMKLEVIPDD